MFYSATSRSFPANGLFDFFLWITVEGPSEYEKTWSCLLSFLEAVINQSPCASDRLRLLTEQDKSRLVEVAGFAQIEDLRIELAVLMAVVERSCPLTAFLLH